MTRFFCPQFKHQPVDLLTVHSSLDAKLAEESTQALIRRVDAPTWLH